MAPMSMPGPGGRPFYGSFAWAYDLLNPRAVAAECAQITTTLAGRGIPAPAQLLDAGCGTGRYAIELARGGFVVTGLDAAAELLAVARQQAGADAVTFVHADLGALAPAPAYQAVLCRGVLNDLVEDRARREAFRAFARALTRGGALVLDVREWEATRRRKTREPLLERVVPTAQGTLTYRSETRLDHATAGRGTSSTASWARSDSWPSSTPAPTIGRCRPAPPTGWSWSPSAGSASRPALGSSPPGRPGRAGSTPGRYGRSTSTRPVVA